MLAMYLLLRLCNVIGWIGTPDFCIFGWPWNLGAEKSVGFKYYSLLSINSLPFRVPLTVSMSWP